MARIRSIKPEFWQDELVATLPRDIRLLFIGLWTMADDEGRFRANPRFVQAQVFPYDSDIDVAGALRQLEGIGRVQLYEADGQLFGWVRKFSEHQRIDKPKPSTIPPPPVPDESKMRPRRVRDASKTSPGRKGGEGKGEEGRGEEAAGPAPEDFQAVWNQNRAPEMPEWREMTDDRRAQAKARLGERPLEDWIAIVERLAKSGFARGLIPGRDGKRWRADPEFILRPSSATKILEGKYDDRPGERQIPVPLEEDRCIPL